MGCCQSQNSDDSPASDQSKPKTAAVSPINHSDWSTTVTAAPVGQSPPPTRTGNNSISFGRPAAKKKKTTTVMMLKKEEESTAAGSFSFDKKDKGNQAVDSPLASDVWSVVATPARQGNGGAEEVIELSSEIWSVADAPSIMFSPTASPALISPSPLTPPGIFSPIGKRESTIEKQSPYLSGRESETEQLPAVVLSSNKRETEKAKNPRSSLGLRVTWKLSEEQEGGYGRRSEEGAGGRAVVSSGKENERGLKGGNDVVLSREQQGNESSDGSLSIEGFVFL